jgi:hypothetical protein
VSKMCDTMWNYVYAIFCIRRSDTRENYKDAG